MHADEEQHKRCDLRHHATSEHQWMHAHLRRCAQGAMVLVLTVLTVLTVLINYAITAPVIITGAGTAMVDIAVVDIAVVVIATPPCASMSAALSSFASSSSSSSLSSSSSWEKAVEGLCKEEDGKERVRRQDHGVVRCRPCR